MNPEDSQRTEYSPANAHLDFLRQELHTFTYTAVKSGDESRPQKKKPYSFCLSCPDFFYICLIRRPK